jgi:hypothetical protein
MWIYIYIEKYICTSFYAYIYVYVYVLGKNPFGEGEDAAYGSAYDFFGGGEEGRAACQAICALANIGFINIFIYICICVYVCIYIYV